jgi:hypothetical protein
MPTTHRCPTSSERLPWSTAFSPSDLTHTLQNLHNLQKMHIMY